MVKESLAYGVVFTKGGIVRREFGTAPGYLSEFISNIDLIRGVFTSKVRNDHVTYTMGNRNVYLVVYRDAEIEEEVKRTIAEIREKTEEKQGGEDPQGWFAGDSSENAAEAETAADEEKKDSEEDEDESFSGWKGLKKKIDLFDVFKRKNISEKEIREHLVSRNVPVELSALLSKEISEVKRNSASEMPEKEKIRYSIKKVVSESVPVLPPEKIIEEIRQRKTAGKGPYVFCMVGVNGVGKSTTLSKLCLWILRHRLSVCVAACDGFRSGAIEQLKKYVERFQKSGHTICLYEKGYKKDESSIANKAISHAAENKFDVVLIDTCGRMPGNAASMSSLSKMIRVNRPQKIFYVGEALVGNDSVEQIRTFNSYVEKACVDKSIDGIIVTKCDTVDEKVGTIIGLAHAVAKPVVFIGVGQKNVDLLPFEIDSLCEALSI